MAETVSGSRYQRLHHMLSESAWNRSGVRRQLIADANVHFGHASALVIDESAFAKKGDMSAGVGESDLRIEEHYTDTAGFTDHVFALMHLLGFRFAPRIRDLGDTKLCQ